MNDVIASLGHNWLVLKVRRYGMQSPLVTSCVFVAVCRLGENLLVVINEEISHRLESLFYSLFDLSNLK